MQRIAFTVSPGFQTMSLAVISVFEFANMEIGRPVYDVHLLSETGGSIRTSMGMSITAEPFDDTNFDTLIVSGTTVIESSTPGLIKFVRQGWGDIGGLRQPAPAPSFWPKRVCSTAGAPPRIGIMRAICGPDSQK